jgi:hypothetical protein
MMLSRRMVEWRSDQALALSQKLNEILRQPNLAVDVFLALTTPKPRDIGWSTTT